MYDRPHGQFAFCVLCSVNSNGINPQTDHELSKSATWQWAFASVNNYLYNTKTPNRRTTVNHILASRWHLSTNQILSYINI